MQLQSVDVKKVNTSDKFVCFLQNSRVKQMLVCDKFALDISMFETKVMLLLAVHTRKTNSSQNSSFSFKYLNLRPSLLHLHIQVYI